MSIQSSVAAAEQPYATMSKRQIRFTLVAMITSLVAVVSAMSGLNVAQQDLAVALGASQSGVLWIINAYTLALAALLLPIGAIGDRWGRKSVLLTGLALFGIATAGAVVAQSVPAMIAARAIAGAGAAMIMPVTLSIITSSFPSDERAKAIGVWAGFAGAGGMIGMFISAFMIDVVSWRWVFALPLVLVLNHLLRGGGVLCEQAFQPEQSGRDLRILMPQALDELHEERRGNGRFPENPTHQRVWIRFAVGDVQQFVRHLICGYHRIPALDDVRHQAPKILHQHDAQGDGQRPQLADGERLYLLVAAHETPQRFDFEAAVAMGNARPGHPEYPRITGKWTARELG